ncbi:chromatin assembly factor 1 subunit FAS1-like [Populus alba x Populus x berolinensis]|uniref:Chromatin assembly factor 1 subunit FAS1-like n=1 Tax=Populus alba x Populus x berolinensis TaxID=444605 RepID=A0AAD6MCP0_9ROSI|nr:chromatin assembly factor 1 subunit FAS1-like [Populus alba x Populus x berolinensis]
MAEVVRMAIDGEDESKPSSQDQPKKTLKRKRATLTPKQQQQVLNIRGEQKGAKIEELKREIKGLLGYYKETTSQKMGFGFGVDLSGNECSNVNAMVGLLMEESGMSFTKLVEEIYKKLVKMSGNLTVAVVKNAALFVGQRVMYGVPNVDADILEDETHSCLWCWETRDFKLMPKSVHGALKIRRTCRKKIHDRIAAVSEMIIALQKQETDQNYESDLIKSSEKLGKVLTEADIRLLIDGLLQKNGAEIADKDAKQEEKLLVKQLKKNKREEEKEKKRMDLELQKEKRQTEREQKRLQEEAEKDERRCEREESEVKRQLKRQQEEVEKEQRRKEKEEAELKRRVAIQKQASMMERFLKRSESNSPCQNDQTLTKATIFDSSSQESKGITKAITQLMDCALSSNDNITADGIRKSHLSSWCYLGFSIRANRKQHWSIRRKPKTGLFRELKLTAIRDPTHNDDSSAEKLDSGWGHQTSDDRSCGDVRKCNQRKQLLQFDKSHRPAFYGIWPKKSHVVGPCHPFGRDPDLDYNVDSDEEWEEEDPGESLSDCDKDDGEEMLQEEYSKADEEEESEDGFFVPDGYLSENEGVQLDRMDTDLSVEEARSSPCCKQDLQSEEFCTLLKQQKYLNNFTDNALRKNHPLIMLNLMHEKDAFLVADDLGDIPKVEKMCLQALCIRAFPGGPQMEISLDVSPENHDAWLSNAKPSATLIPTMITLQDSDMPVVVFAIQSCSQSMNKVVESLHQKFPSVSKSQLRNKVREMSDFVDNRWQVKKEVLDGVGVRVLPEKGRG